MERRLTSVCHRRGLAEGRGRRSLVPLGRPPAAFTTDQEVRTGPLSPTGLPYPETPKKGRLATITGRLLKIGFLPLQIGSMTLGANVFLRGRWKLHAQGQRVPIAKHAQRQ